MTIAIGRRTLLRQTALVMTTAVLTMGTGSIYAGVAQVRGRWLEVNRVSGQVSYQRPGSQPARVGNRLDAPGQGITTGANSSASLAVDNNIGTIAVAANSQLVIRQISSLANGAQVTLLDLPRGQARLQVRRFTNPDSRLELRTPSGLAAVRGTEFGVSVTDTGQTAVGTLEGVVEASAQGQSVQLGAGLVSVIRPGEAPTAPQPLDRDLALNLTAHYRRGRVVYLQGQINPTNRLLLDGTDIVVTPSGRFSTTVVLPSANRGVTLTVANALGESRDYRIRGWWLEDVDRG